MKHSQLSAQKRKVGSRRGGFTLVEILVVLAIAALLSAILFSSFKSVNEGNKKTSCQTNMVQIYQALRLYGQDFNGEFPSYNPHLVGDETVASGKAIGGRAPSGLGLWALYSYPASAQLDCDGRTTQLPAISDSDNNRAPLASYIKSPSSFHCPYDTFDRKVVTGAGCRVPTAVTTLNSSQLEYKDANQVAYLNPFYNSYQTADDQAATTDPTDLATYSSFRTSDSSRQLVYWRAETPNNVIDMQRRTPDTTVITWCRFHRKIDKDGATVDRASNSDNVLFMDGTVRYLPTKQPIGTAQCQGWKRIPEETVEGFNAAYPNHLRRSNALTAQFSMTDFHEHPQLFASPHSPLAPSLSPWSRFWSPWASWRFCWLLSCCRCAWASTAFNKGNAQNLTQSAVQSTLTSIGTDIRDAVYVFPNTRVAGITDKEPYVNKDSEMARLSRFRSMFAELPYYIFRPTKPTSRNPARARPAVPNGINVFGEFQAVVKSCDVLSMILGAPRCPGQRADAVGAVL